MEKEGQGCIRKSFLFLQMQWKIGNGTLFTIMSYNSRMIEKKVDEIIAKKRADKSATKTHHH